jgi:steroid 5-alpha reductase family enzyme
MGAGPLAMLALFVFASIPLAEKRALARRPHYLQRIQTVSMLFPWFPKRS